MKTEIIEKLNLMYPNPKCELNYTKDYELLIATILSAQSTDKRVNEVGKELFKYNLKELAYANPEEIEKIIRSVGTYKRKTKYVIKVARILYENYDGKVPNNREIIESLPGSGRKTCNVVLSNLYKIPCMAVDTHVTRCSKRLGLAVEDDNVLTIEKKLMNYFPKEKWNTINNQLILFGRYTCKSIKPDCSNCLFSDKCSHKKLD